jgi:hypothetical protein
MTMMVMMYGTYDGHTNTKRLTHKLNNSAYQASSNESSGSSRNPDMVAALNIELASANLLSTNSTHETM